MNKKPIYASIIKSKLTEELSPTYLILTDDSHRHAGHAAYQGDGAETHFSLVIISDKFKGLSKVARHRLIYGILKEELKANVHALAIQAFTPEERNNIK
jgi:stress-induced morphogen